MPGQVVRSDDGVLAQLTLDNPQKKNALDRTMLEQLVKHLDDLAASPIRAVVLTATGTVFSAGYDLDALDGTETAAASAYSRAIDAVIGSPVPIVAALNGPAIGGGCELACSCDLRVAHDEVRLRMPPVRLGLVYPPRSLQRFVALIGPSRARELFLTGLPVDAERAKAWGMIDHLVQSALVVEVARGLAAAIAEGVPAAVRATRQLFDRLDAELPPRFVAEAGQTAKMVWESEEAKAARAALRPKK